MKFNNRKIILFDWTNLCLRTAWSGHVQTAKNEIDYQIFNYSLWNSIFLAIRKHKASSVILASDAGSWRQLIYEPYKQQRRLQKEKDKKNDVKTPITDEFFQNLNQFSEELASNLPLIYLKENKCEADDIIGIVCKNLYQNNEITIISGDCDYKQLLKYPNVKLWDPYPSKQRFIELDFDPEEWVQVQALHGQSKDNIFNVFTRIDFPTEYNVMRESSDIACIRKPFLPEKRAWEIVKSGKLDEFLDKIGPEEALKKNKKIEKENKQRIYEGLEPKQLYETNLRDRYKINYNLISFDKIPNVLENRVLHQIENYQFNPNSDHYQFFKKMKWRETIDNFDKIDSTLNYLY